MFFKNANLKIYCDAFRLFYIFYILCLNTVQKNYFYHPLIDVGEMSEWSNEPAWKAGVLATVPRVRIPLSPPCI
jgi:hypothetical protein